MSEYECPCGETHPKDARVEALARRKGETISVVTPVGTWKVPRHYISAHGLKAAELPELGERLGFEKDSTSQMFLLPPQPWLCQECAVEHEPEIPHNPQTLFYQVWFNFHHGRDATWADAMEHCSDETKAAWTEHLIARGVDITSTKLTP